MLDDLFQKQFALARHRSTVFGAHLDDHLEALSLVGHPRGVLRRNVFLITRFGEHLAQCGVTEVGQVTREHVGAFIHMRRELRGRPEATRSPAVGHVLDLLLEHLRARGLWRAQPSRSPSLLDDFCSSLNSERGLQPRTIEGYRHFIEQFLQHLQVTGSAEGLSLLTPKKVDRFVVSAARRYKRRSTGLMCSAIRAFLRYLYRREILDCDLSSTVMLPRFYALERLPCALPWSTVRQLLGAVKLNSPRGRRDHAILLLLVTYGVRPGEIVKLRLEDVDWRNDTIHFRRSKNGRPLAFPLTIDVGESLVRFLRRGRPSTTAREFFVRLDAPFVALGRGSVVSNLVRQYLLKAGIESRHMGAYVIRHSLAVNLLRKRHPLKTISDMLGQRDPRIAYHYTKLATEDLHAVALDAREVMP